MRKPWGGSSRRTRISTKRTARSAPWSTCSAVGSPLKSSVSNSLETARSTSAGGRASAYPVNHLRRILLEAAQGRLRARRIGGLEGMLIQTGFIRGWNSQRLRGQKEKQAQTESTPSGQKKRGTHMTAPHNTVASGQNRMRSHVCHHVVHQPNHFDAPALASHFDGNLAGLELLHDRDLGFQQGKLLGEKRCIFRFGQVSRFFLLNYPAAAHGAV
jgi:hypothetical protein